MTENIILTGSGIQAAITVTMADGMGRERQCTIDHRQGDRVILTDVSDKTTFVRDIDTEGHFTIPPPRFSGTPEQ